MITTYAVIRFKLIFACGSMVLTHFVLRFSRSQSAKNEER
jgi:hypothetical protein